MLCRTNWFTVQLDNGYMCCCVLRVYLQDDTTPLLIACQNGHTLVVEQLIAATVDVDHQTKVGYIKALDKWSHV